MATGLPESTLAYALPELRHQYSASHSMALVGRNVADDPNTVRPACRRCMAAKGITAEVRVWMRHDQASACGTGSGSDRAFSNPEIRLI
jgi:hypothetical protein